MEEKIIRRDLCYKMVRREACSAPEGWYIDDFLANALAILYPYIREGLVEQEEKLDLPFNIIRNFRGKRTEKSLCDSLTESSLVQAIKHRWIPKIEDKEQVAKSFVLFESLSDAGYVKIKQKLVESYLKIQKPSSIDRQYREAEYMHEIEIINRENAEIEEIECNHEQLMQAEENIRKFWDSEKLPTHLDEGQFFWQYKLSASVYETIKNYLTELHFEDVRRSEGVVFSKFIRRNAFYVAMFLAEWFKREYDGYENGNGLAVIGLEAIQSKNIWEGAGLPDSYLINSGQNEYLFSLYVLGGFPIKYIKRVRRFDSLFKNIWKAKKGESLDDEVVADISESFDTNNMVYHESLHPGGSLYAYIEELLDDNILLDENDLQNEPYLTYCTMLADGKRACYDNYFSDSWDIFTDEQSEGVDTCINVKVGFLKDQSYIPSDYVFSWDGMSDGTAVMEFLLGLETDTGIKSPCAIRFSKCGNSFVGWGDFWYLSMIFDIQNTGSIKVVWYKVEDVNRGAGIPVREYGVPESFQIYLTETPYKWTTVKNTKSRTAIFFNAFRYTLADDRENAHILLSADTDTASWIWVRIYDTITLIDVRTNEEVLFSSKQGTMNVFFAKQQGICYNSLNEVNHVYMQDDGSIQSESVPLLLGIGGIRSVKLYPFESGDRIQRLRLNDCEFTYKQGSDWNYKSFTEESPKNGMIQLKVVYRDYKPIIRKCFFVSHRNILERNLQTKQIRFLHPDVNIQKPGEDDEYMEMKDQVFSDEDYRKDKDVIPFRLLGDNDDYVELNVYRANPCREIYFADECLASREGGCIDIPLILKDQFRIRTIDREGVRWNRIGNQIMLDYRFKYDNGRQREIVYEDNQEQLRYYLYTSKSMAGHPSNELNISPRQKDNYRFYYWTFDTNDEPEQLATSFDETNRCLVVPLDRLAGRRSGIIFQSLKDAAPPNYVFPYYPGISWPVLKNERFNEDVRIECMRIAVEHRVYFSQFYPLLRLFEGNDKGRQLVSIVMKFLRKYNRKKDFLAMHRLADEFLFDWLLLPYSSWKDTCRCPEDKKLAENLFRSNPHITSPMEKTSLDLLLNEYWKLPRPADWEFRRNNGRVENLALQSMRSKEKDYSFIPIISTETNIEILKEIHESELFYTNLRKDIFDIIKGNTI